ncbi:MAG: sulfatase-like hydrolase/transferase, partial [Spirochaetales bacterium]|nr:sulfatase-like hydrolase/transferase [Spirochaetales bacterium]
GFSVKEKVQLYGMAAIFLVLLYNSPSGLVLYWTMNNLFSLLKNIFMKLIKNPKRVIRYLLTAAGLSVIVFTIINREDFNYEKKILCLGFAAVCFAPQVLFIAKRFMKQRKTPKPQSESKGLFILCALTLSLVLGAVIPLFFVSSSPLEFIRPAYGPLRLVFDTFSVALGFFLVWGGIFYALSSKNNKRFFIYVYIALTGFFLVDFFIFGKNIGLISSELVFDNVQIHGATKVLLNLVLAAIGAALLLVSYKFFPKILKYFFTVLLVSLIGLSCVWSAGIVKKAYPIERGQEGTTRKMFHLSKEGNNVIVMMLDRVIGAYLPYIVNERPDVAEALSDFTFYPNTMSFGRHTNFASAALFGGYEYTPTEINNRTDETLREKQDEAISVLPVLFWENGYEVTVCDPPYAGYQWIPDLSIYDKYQGISAYNLTGLYKIKENDDKQMEKSHTRSMFYYALMKCFPLAVSDIIYDDGYYYSTKKFGINYEFYNSVAVLYMLPDITGIIEDETDTFLMIQNDTPHNPINLSYPDYSFASDANDEPDPGIRMLPDGSVLDLSSGSDRAHYHTLVHTMMLLSQWFDYMKENGVWDNTRIVIASDHGIESLGTPTVVKDGVYLDTYNPILLFKDFNGSGTSDGMKIDRSFMTNADVPTLAVTGVIENPENPFTGKIIDNAEKFAHPQILTTSKLWNIDDCADSVQFDTSDGQWYAVTDDVYDPDKWILVE